MLTLAFQTPNPKKLCSWSGARAFDFFSFLKSNITRFKSVRIKKLIKKRKLVKKVGKGITNLSKDGLQYWIF